MEFIDKCIVKEEKILFWMVDIRLVPVLYYAINIFYDFARKLLVQTVVSEKMAQFLMPNNLK